MTIPYLQELTDEKTSIKEAALENLGFEANIDKVNWPEFDYKPECKVYIGHDNTSIFLFYKVDEQNIRATYTRFNDAVWEDSCVEAFFSTNPDAGYYNFEFNCLGTPLAAHGTNRSERTFLSDNQMNTIDRVASLGPESMGKSDLHTPWTLLVKIPFALLNLEKGGNLFANFYKCGDKCKTPHFLSWQGIQTPSPDFHQASFFAKIHIE